jgi:hypothetical protein
MVQHEAHNCTEISDINDMSSGMKYDEVSQMQDWRAVKVTGRTNGSTTRATQIGMNLLDESVHHQAQPQSTKVSRDPGVGDEVQARDILIAGGNVIVHLE